MDKGFTVVVLSTLIFGFTFTGQVQAANPSKLLGHYQTPLLDVTNYYSNVENKEDERPPLNAGRITGEVLTGGLIGGLFGGGGFAVGWKISGEDWTASLSMAACKMMRVELPW